MLVRLVILASLAVLAVVVATLLQRRRPEPPSAPSYRSPTQLDPTDFFPAQHLSSSVVGVFVVMFGSTTCDTCPHAWDTIQAIAGLSDSVSTARVDVQDRPDVHKRYRIDGVPTTVVCDDQGVVTKTYFGAVDPEGLATLLGQ